jgi:hybrid polyketide synthase / nonribosomal peptide synthetase ACE1
MNSNVAFNTGTILRKLQQMLQLSAEITADQDTLLQQGTDALGVDSLVAVELRTWLLREIEVDIPVLTILGELTVRDLISCCVERLSPDMVPMLGQEGSADLPPTFLDQAVDKEILSSPSVFPSSPQEPLHASPSGERVEGPWVSDSDSGNHPEAHIESRKGSGSLDPQLESSTSPSSGALTSHSTRTSVSDISLAASEHQKPGNISHHRAFSPPHNNMTTLTVG